MARLRQSRLNVRGMILTVPSGDRKRKLQYDNRTRCGGEGKQCLRESYGESFVHHVHSPCMELIGRVADCASRRCITNGIPDEALSFS